MKKRLTGLLSLAIVSLFMACTGNQTATKGKDTSEAKHAEPQIVDTSKTTTTTGSASNVDDSGSGGINVDTPKKKKK